MPFHFWTTYEKQLNTAQRPSWEYSTQMSALNYGEPPRKLRRSLIHSIREFWRYTGQTDIKSATKWKYSNDQAFVNNQRKTFEMGNPCSPNRQQFELNKHQNWTSPTWVPCGKRMRRRPRLPAGDAHWRKREKNLGGGVLLERGVARLLQASVVSGVFCYTVSCVLRDRKR